MAALLTGLPHTWHRSADNAPRLRVQPSEERAWQLCETAAALAETSSWTDRTVDPARRAPAILWAAVGRSLKVERQYLDVQRALTHESLQDLGRETLARVERERESLDAVEVNLGTVLATARDIDRRRAELEQERAASGPRSASCAAGWPAATARSTGAADSDRQADLAAGLAAETEAIAGLLADSDALLQDLD